MFFGGSDWVVIDVLMLEFECGCYLVEVFGYCGECYMFCNVLGGLDCVVWLMGFVFSGEGKVSGIILFEFDWSLEDIVYYLESGFIFSWKF